MTSAPRLKGRRRRVAGRVQEIGRLQGNGKYYRKQGEKKLGKVCEEEESTETS